MEWLEKLFINEAKASLSSKGSPSSKQITEAVNAYLDKNPVSSATAKIENGALKVK